MIIGIRNTLRFLACTLLLMSTIGCAGMLMAKNAEPPVIIARNASDIDMERVTLSSPPDVPGKPTRFGTISPVPKGASQVFVRPADPPRFPETVLIEWIDARGNRYSRHVSLKNVLKSATGSKGEALVFEFGRDGKIVVYLQRSGRN